MVIRKINAKHVIGVVFPTRMRVHPVLPHQQPGVSGIDLPNWHVSITCQGEDRGANLQQGTSNVVARAHPAGMSKVAES